MLVKDEIRSEVSEVEAAAKLFDYQQHQQHNDRCATDDAGNASSASYCDCGYGAYSFSCNHLFYSIAKDYQQVFKFVNIFGTNFIASFFLALIRLLKRSTM